MTIEPTALKSAEFEERAHFGNRLKRVEDALVDSMARFPARLLKVIEDSEHGQIVVTHQIDVMIEGRRRNPQGAYHRDSRLVQITPEALAKNQGVTEEEIVHLLDHLLGSEGGGLNLSERVSSRPSLEPLAAEVADLAVRIALGPGARKNNREWLARAVREFITDPELLQLLAPEAYALIGALSERRAMDEQVLAVP